MTPIGEALVNRTRRQMHNRKIVRLRFFAVAILAASAVAPVALSQSADRPWMNTNLSPEERADLVLKQMTLEEKLSLLTGMGWRTIRSGPCRLRSSPMAARDTLRG